jgi:uronate dehydrogenase
MTPRTAVARVDVPFRPDGLYGVSKVYGEALARLYHDRHGIAVACLRLGTYREQPTDVRHLSTWLSPGDLVRLMQAAVTCPSLGFATVYGISANTRGWWDLEPGRRMGYEPRDDAEDHAARILAGADPMALDPSRPANATIGGR